MLTVCFLGSKPSGTYQFTDDDKLALIRVTFWRNNVDVEKLAQENQILSIASSKMVHQLGIDGHVQPNVIRILHDQAFIDLVGEILARKQNYQRHSPLGAMLNAKSSIRKFFSRKFR